MVQTITPRQRVFYRQEHKTILAKEVEKEDELLGMKVIDSEPDVQRYIWLIKAITDDETAGFQLRITEDAEVTVIRTRQVGENECRSCGRLNIKYSARHLCNTCYQREYRAGLTRHQRTG